MEVSLKTFLSIRDKTIIFAYLFLFNLYFEQKGKNILAKLAKNAKGTLSQNLFWFETQSKPWLRIFLASFASFARDAFRFRPVPSIGAYPG